MTGGTYPYDAADGDADFITMARLSGRGIPDSWKRQYEWGRDPELDTEAQGEPSAAMWAEHCKLMKPLCASDADADALIAMLQHIFTLDLAERPNAADVLKDPWFTFTDIGETGSMDTQETC
ncbi:hypothetical protein PENSPDRAFT_753321 [Peniophora sp. CONT]|nr:hypothetical protein PENSPDRAFT_753321 [Peniophora sp. CONT]